MEELLIWRENYAFDQEFLQTICHNLLKTKYLRRKVLVHFENDPGDTIVKFYKNGTGKAQQQILDASISATTTAIFDVLNTGVGVGSADRTFSVGDLLSISITPENAPGEVNVTSVWEYDMQA